MCISKKKVLMNPVFKVQFSYCPLVWIYQNRVMNYINRLHKRCLRIICNNKTSSWIMLAKDGSVTIHIRNLPVLATELFKVNKNMSTELIQRPFCVRQTHFNLRNPHHFAIPSINSVYHGSESISNPSFTGLFYRHS